MPVPQKREAILNYVDFKNKTSAMRGYLDWFSSGYFNETVNNNADVIKCNPDQESCTFFMLLP